MAILTVDPDIVAAPVLRELIGVKRTERFGSEHPLYPGLKALSQFERRVFTPNLRALWQLEFDGRTIIADLSARGFDDRLGDDLSSESSCRALLFESRVSSLFLHPYVHAVSWRRYEESASDFLTAGPRLQVECTQTNDYGLEAMQRAATTRQKRKQRREDEGPYVLMVGTSTLTELHIFGDVDSGLRRKFDRWYAEHREIAAVHFCAPQRLPASESVSWIDEETFTYRSCHYTGFTVRNIRAIEPMPDGFELNWTMSAGT